MNIGDFVFAEYDNGEIVNGEIVTIKTFGDRTMLTIEVYKGFRSIYLDKCVSFEHWPRAAV